MLKSFLAAWICIGEIVWFTQSSSVQEFEVNPLTHIATFQTSAPKTYAISDTTHKGYQRFAKWLYPIAEINTEKNASYCVMFHLPTAKHHNAFWIESGIQELIKPLLDTTSHAVGLDENCLRYSIGSGYRYLFNSKWMLGSYCYYDYEKATHTSAHTINIGIENHFAGWRTIGNAYFSFSKPFISQIDSYKWAWDYKIEKDYSSFKIGVGAYYKEIQVTSLVGRDMIEKEGDSQYTLPLYGGCLELKYPHQFRIYSLKYSYDWLEEHKINFNIQWQLLQPLKRRSSTKLANSLWQPTERYLKPSKMNAKGKKRLKETTEHYAKNYITRFYRATKPKVRPFCDGFTNAYTKTTLRQKEVNILHQCAQELADEFSQLPFAQFPAPLACYREGVSALCSSNILKKPTINLSALITAQSITQHLLWLDLLHCNNESTISITLNRNLQNALLRNSRFTPTQKQLSLINDFTITTGSYFTSSETKRLMQMKAQQATQTQDNSEVSWTLNALNNNHITKERHYTVYDHTKWQISGLGDRLYRLQEIATYHLDFYKTHIASRDNIANTDTLQSIHQSLQKEITANLLLQRTALFLSDCPSQLRFTLLCFSNFELNHANQLTAPMVQGLRKLPPEIQKEILKHIFIELIEKNPSLQAHETTRSLIFQNFIPLFSSQTQENKRRLMGLYAERALLYLYDIHSRETYGRYLNIPNTCCRFLF